MFYKGEKEMILKADKTRITPTGVKINEYFLTQHNPNKIDMPGKRVKPLLGVTIHNTGPINVRDTTMSEQYTRATYNGNMNSVRVHYYVDDTEAWQNLPLNYQGWHAADGNGDGNSSTIAIECIMGGTAGYEKAEDNCARLAAHILLLNGLTTANLYTHTYWLNVRDGRGTDLNKDDRCTLAHPYKTCPAYIIPHWKEFVKKVDKYIIEQGQSSGTPKYYVQVGAFSNKANAEKYLESVKKDYPDAFVKVM